MSEPIAERRLEALRRAVEDFPRRAAAVRAEIADAAAQTASGTAGHGEVVVTVTGAGDIQAVRVSDRALRTMDNQALAHHVMTAINDALNEAGALVSRPTSDEESTEAVTRYEARMNALLDRLDAIEQDLDY